MAHDTQHAYKGRYKFNSNGDLYIHQHSYCIGNAMKGSAESDSSLSKVFASQKTAASNAVKKFYTKLYIDNLSLSEQELALLSSAFEVSSEELIKMIDKAVKDKMGDLMSKENLENLLEQQKNAVKNAKDMFSGDAKKQLKAFNDMLDAISKASELVTSKHSTALAQLLANLKYKRFIGLSQMGGKLENAIDTFVKTNKITKADDEQMFKVVSALKTFANTLSTGVTKGNKKNLLTQDNIVKVIDSLFSPAFSESIASVLKGVEEHAAIDTLKASLTGTDSPHGILTDHRGNIIGFDNTPAQGKMDFRFKNIAVSLEHEGSGNTQSVSMRVGVSNKLYRDLKFSNGEKIPALTFNSGSGGTLQEAIDALIPGGKVRLKYLAYNALAHWQELDETTAALNDVLLTRQVIRMFATRGGSEDFAQYLFINGEVVSFMELLSYVTNAENSLSKSRTQITQKDSQAAALSIAGRPALADKVKIRNAALRTSAVNEVIKTSTISAQLRVHKLAQALESQA